MLSKTRLVPVPAAIALAWIDRYAAERDRRNVNDWMRRFDAAKRRAA